MAGGKQRGPRQPDAAAESSPAGPAGGVKEAAAGFPVVGIGASAGGLAAFEAFFSGMPAAADPGMAFVLVQHLAPDHKSILSELVRRHTRMRVFDVEDGMTVHPNCAYIIPPNRDMAFLNGALHLLEPAAARGQRLPIDFFFRTLSQDQHERAIGIVLSGTGSDGTLGVRAIKGEGGMAMAQTLDSTEFDGMPRSAIATGLVDFVMPPAEMPAQLIAYVTHAFGTATGAATPPPRSENALRRVAILLRAQTGHDFSGYKQNTVTRRIERRMAVHQIARLDEYVRYLQQTPAEVEALFRDILIGVTNFFRDPEAFAALQEQVVPRLIEKPSEGAVVRVWVPACSTGEEAYSIAILLQERLDLIKRGCKVQVFATDIDRQAIEQARAGVYPTSIDADVSAERLARFFVRDPDGNTYRVSKSIRDMLVFSEQDVIQDPPFSKVDLISCRNLLIYLGGELQSKLLTLFHYALNRGGTLFLGTSETVGGQPALFGLLDRKAKLYLRKDDVPGALHQAADRFRPPTARDAPAPWRPDKERGPARLPLRELTERALLQRYGAAGALVSERGEILYLHGRTGAYLEPAPGESSVNILKMAREGLRRELASALHAAVKQHELVRRLGLRVKTNGDFVTVDVTIAPLPAASGAPGEPALYVIVFEEAQAQPERATDGGAPSVFAEGAGDAAVDARVEALAQELRTKDEYLQTTIEELETSNEELQSSNEEMQSVNEELQSTNEELETAKEELQSVNEELATVNAELQTRVVDLSRANNDMINLMAGIGTIFVDHQLRVTRFTPSVTAVINLIAGDVGRPLGHVAGNLAGYDRLSEDVRAVLDRLTPREVEVQAKDGAWFLLRIQPYRTAENVIEGAVITFTDITEVKRAQAAMRDADMLRRLAVVVRDSHDAIVMSGLDGRILAWNPAAERMYGWSEAEALAMNIREIIPEDQRARQAEVGEQLRRRQAVVPFRSRRLAKDGRIVEVWLTASALVGDSGEVYAVATTAREIGSAGEPTGE